MTSKALFRTSMALTKFSSRSSPSLMIEAFQLLGPGFRHAAHTFDGIQRGDGAFAHPVIQAIGVTVPDPEPLRGAQRLSLRRHRVPHRLLISGVHPLVPFCGLRPQASGHLERVAVAGLFGIALV